MYHNVNTFVKILTYFTLQFRLISLRINYKPYTKAIMGYRLKIKIYSNLK